MGSRAPHGGLGVRGTLHPFHSACVPAPPAVEGALAGQRHRNQNAENPGLDDAKEPGLQRGVPKTAVSAAPAWSHPGMCLGSLPASGPGHPGTFLGQRQLSGCGAGRSLPALWGQEYSRVVAKGWEALGDGRGQARGCRQPLPVLRAVTCLAGSFPTPTCCRCWAPARPLQLLTPSSSATGCPTAPCTTSCTRGPVSAGGWYFWGQQGSLQPQPWGGLRVG